MAQHCCYIMTNHTRTLYVGMTDDIRRRTFEHKTGYFEASFTDRYQMGFLVYFEELSDGLSAVKREKQLKSWTRMKKIALIEKQNPKWIDLSEPWFTAQDLEAGILSPVESGGSFTSKIILPGGSVADDLARSFDFGEYASAQDLI